MVYGDVVLAEEVRQARQAAVGHLLLGLVGGAVAAWTWQDPWQVLSWFPGLRGIVAFLAVAAALYELASGIQHWQKANRLAEVPAGREASVEPAAGCRRCGRPLLPGRQDCAVCGEPA